MFNNDKDLITSLTKKEKEKIEKLLRNLSYDYSVQNNLPSKYEELVENFLNSELMGDFLLDIRDLYHEKFKDHYYDIGFDEGYDQFECNGDCDEW